MRCLSFLVVLVAVLVAVFIVVQPGPNGFEIHQWLAQKRLDFRHKNVIITGGHEGVGREVTKALAHLGARIWVMAARTEECDPVVQQIIQETSNSRIECQFMDPGNLDSVEVIGRLWRHLDLPLHVLIHASAVKGIPYKETSDGYEMHFTHNHLGPFLLTNLLSKYLQRGAPSRVITVSSSAHKVRDLDWKDLFGNKTWYSRDTFVDTHLGPWLAYAQSKTANILFTKSMNAELKGFGKANAVNPGRVIYETLRQTEQRERREKRAKAGQEPQPEWMQILQNYLAKARSVLLGKTPEEAASTILYLATAPEIDARPGGEYWEDCNPSTAVADYAVNAQNADKLWKKSQTFTSKYLRRH